MLLLVGLLTVLQLWAYLAAIPAPGDRPPRPVWWARPIGVGSYWLAYSLGLLRVPLAALPYLTKLWLHLVLRVDYKTRANTAWLEALGLAGDAANLLVGLLVVVWVVGPLDQAGWWGLVYVPVVAEGIRLVCERGQMVLTALWQWLPHRRLARWLERSPAMRWAEGHGFGGIRRYRHYYRLSDPARAQYLLRLLKERAASDPLITECLSYVQAFRIVPASHRLRAGQVRDVAAGEVFIHARWTNDPGLLIGQALRRSPWVFDPRWLARPFRYWTAANPLTTRFVLSQAAYCPQFAVFQFGHAMQTARHDCFYRLMRRIGHDLEGWVRSDGSYDFDPLVRWLQGCLGQAAPAAPSRRLWTDSEVLFDLRRRHRLGQQVSPAEIARQYTYPRCYVDEVLSRPARQRQGHLRLVPSEAGDTRSQPLP